MRVIVRSLTVLMVGFLLPFVTFAGGNEEREGSERQPAQLEHRRETVPMDDETATILYSMDTAPYENRIPAKDLVLPLLGGGETSILEHQGKILLLNFWATWCPPCREEMPSLQALYEELKDEGLEILAIDVQEAPPVVDEFLADYSFSFPIVLDENSRASLTYSVRAFPTTYILDRAGNVLAVKPGYHDWAAPEVVAGFRQLLAQ